MYSIAILQKVYSLKRQIFFCFALFLFFVPMISFAAPSTKAECDNAQGTCRAYYCKTKPVKEEIIGVCDDVSEDDLCCTSNPDSIKQNNPDAIPGSPTNASFSYTPLETIPGTEGTDTSTIEGFFQGMYRFALWSIGVAALFMITIGGFWYLTSAGNTSRVGESKKIIGNALAGLAIVLFAWLILYVINPDLVKIDLRSLDFLKMNDLENFSSLEPLPDGSIPTGIPAGSCGGMNVRDSQVASQCDLASSALSSMLSCMKSKGDAGIVTSVTSSVVGNDIEKSKKCCGDPGCPHATYTCHYGCKSPQHPFAGELGVSHAIDYGTSASASNEQLCAIAERAWSCGAGSNIWGPRNISCNGGSIRYQSGHGTHLHIPTATCNH